MAKRLLDPNSQKSHYVVDTCGRKSRKVLRTHRTPFCVLNHESDNLVKHRYQLYEKVWGHQRRAIHGILDSANNALFASLLRYIRGPSGAKLNVMYLGLSSNTANNLRVVEEFSGHVAREESAVRVVRLNSKVCFNVKAAVREVVKQVVDREKGNEKGNERHNDDDDDNDDENENDQVNDNDNDNDSDNDSENDSDNEQVGEDEDEDEKAKVSAKKPDDDDDIYIDADDKDQLDQLDGRISYDFAIVEEWARDVGPETRVVIVLEDTNSFANEVLNQLLQLFCVYAASVPLKVVMALSSKNVSTWISTNIAANLRLLVAGCKLVAQDNKDIGFQVVNDILLQHEITPENPLLLDAHLSLIVLGRFENSNNSIDSLITELRFAYMAHFYQLPLAALVDPDFKPSAFHYAALRKLPSFKTHMEVLLHNYKEGEQNRSTKATEKKTLTLLLSDDEAVHRLFNEAKTTFQTYQNAVMNAVNLVHFLGSGDKHRFQIYKLVTNNQLINSVFLSDVLKRVLAYDSDRIARLAAFVHSNEIKTNIGECTDTDIISLQTQLNGATPETVVALLTAYLHGNKHLNMKISDNLFNEVLTINGGISELDQLRPSVTLEENYENLMINVIRPKLRETIEVGLDEPQKYLRNALVLENANIKQYSRLAGPVLSKLYQVYKDAPVNINIWDFYVAFKLTLLKQDVVRELHEGLAESDMTKELQEIVKRAESHESEWDKLVYAWFLQNCFELSSMGFLREKTKGDYVEKMIWKNL